MSTDGFNMYLGETSSSTSCSSSGQFSVVILEITLLLLFREISMTNSELLFDFRLTGSIQIDWVDLFLLTGN